MDAVRSDGLHHGADHMLSDLSDAGDRFFLGGLLPPAHGEPSGISTRRQRKKEGSEATTGT